MLRASYHGAPHRPLYARDEDAQRHRRRPSVHHAHVAPHAPRRRRARRSALRGPRRAAALRARAAAGPPELDAAGRAGDDLRGARPRAGARPPGADLPRAAPGGRVAARLAALQGVADRLRADQAVAEHERVDAVLGVRLLRLRVPLDEQHVTLEDLRRDVPLGVRQVGEQLLEPLADAVLAAERPRRRDEHRVVRVVLDDAVDVAADQDLGVVLEDLLRGARRRRHARSSRVPTGPPRSSLSRARGATTAVVRVSPAMAEESAALTYTSYLALDEILAAQRPKTDEHDELLFIVIHQVYELWFKQLIHELVHLQQRLETGEGPRALATVRRVLTILKTVVAQIDVLETMTPGQFASFRTRLDSASGFQSAQFRELEAVLGRRDDGALGAYEAGSPLRARIEDAMRRRSVFDSFVRYLATQGLAAPASALDRDVTLPLEANEGLQAAILEAYRRDGEAAQVAERLVDLDEGVQEWRYRHVKMVERTIGDKAGTGGSSGAEYLRTTLFHAMFPDLWAVRSAL